MTPEAKAREIAVRNCPMQCDLPFSEMGKAVWTLGLQDEIEQALRQVRLDALEEAAKVADEYANEWRIAQGVVGLTVSTGIASTIRFLMKTEDETQ